MESTTNLRSIREALGSVADTVGRNKLGQYVARRGFFYTNGFSSDQFATRCVEALRRAGINVRAAEHGEKWASFRGGASVAAQSHWWVALEIAQ